MILFITNKEDITIDILVDKLNKKSINYYRLNTEDLIEKIDINIDLKQSSFLLYDKIKKIHININNIKSVYYRRPKLPELLLLDNISESERNYLKHECFYILQGIYDFLNIKFWINSYWSILKAENKILQLQVAKKVGLKIPNSLITNNVSLAKKFNSKQECVIKPIKSGFIKDIDDPQIIFTNIFNPLKNEIEKVSLFPTYFQSHIKKQADIRVTIVGKNFFVAKICSQDKKSTSVDWRAGKNYDLKYEHIELPKKVQESCKKFMKALHLNYGALDFILEPNGEYCFLEINPNGQWGWIEKRLNLPISDAIIDLLLNYDKYI